MWERPGVVPGPRPGTATLHDRVDWAGVDTAALTNTPPPALIPASALYGPGSIHVYLLGTKV